MSVRRGLRDIKLPAHSAQISLTHADTRFATPRMEERLTLGRPRNRQGPVTRVRNSRKVIANGMDATGEASSGAPVFRAVGAGGMAVAAGRRLAARTEPQTTEARRAAPDVIGDSDEGNFLRVRGRRTSNVPALSRTNNNKPGAPRGRRGRQPCTAPLCHSSDGGAAEVACV